MARETMAAWNCKAFTSDSCLLRSSLALSESWPNLRDEGSLLPQGAVHCLLLCMVCRYERYGVYVCMHPVCYGLADIQRYAGFSWVKDGGNMHPAEERTTWMKEK